MDWGTAAAVAGIGLPALWFVVRFVRRVNHFIDDYFGEKARPGVPARPGVMESISSLGSEVAAVKQQVQNSHITNMRDDIDGLIGDVRSLHTKLDGHLQPPSTTINVNPGGQP